jgi:hypothetical protein
MVRVFLEAMKDHRNPEEQWRRILRDPGLLLHRLERRSGYVGETPPPLEDIEAHFVRMSRRSYRESSHLDRRLMPSTRGSHRRTLRDLLDRRREIEGSANRVTYLFHTAFCGSTLLASCLDHRGACLSYKEPLSLTQLCLAKPRAGRPASMKEGEWLELSRATVGLLSKVFLPSEVPLIKPANVCNGSIAELLSAGRSGAGAILLYSSLTDFLCSILKSDGRRRWARLALDWTWPTSPSHRFLSKIEAADLPDEAVAAYVWLWQMYAYLDAFESPGRSGVRSLDCDLFFSRPEETLSAAARFLSLPLPEDAIPRITNSRTFRTYSKVERAGLGAWLRRLGVPVLWREKFDARKRRTSLQRTAERHRREIESALAWTATVTRERPIPGTLPSPLLT